MGSRFEVDRRVAATADRVDVVVALPWSREPGERRRLAWCLVVFLILFLPLALIVPRIELPEPDRTVQERIPPQLAKLIREKSQPEVKPVPALKPVPEPKPEPKPEPQSKPAPEPPAARPKPESPPPKPDVKPDQTVQDARDVASRSGLMALQDELSSMRSMAESEPASRMTANVDAAASGAAIRQEPDKQAVLAGAGVEDVDGPQEEVKLARHEVKEVAAPERKAEAQTVGKTEAAAGPGERSMANIRRVFDQQKTVLFALYNRELRKNPLLEGEVLLELTIEPDGRVSDCRVVSSELEAPALEQKIVNRVRLFNFGAAEVKQRQVRFPIDFLPS